MPDHEEKHNILPSRHAELKTQGIYAALEAIKDPSSSNLPFDILANQIAFNTRTALKVQCAAIWIADDQHKHIFLQSFSNFDSNESNPKSYNINLDDEESPVSKCLNHLKPLLHTKHTLDEMDPRSVTLTNNYASAVLPLLTPSGPVGVLELLTSSNDAINQTELESLEVLANQIALVLSNHQQLQNAARQTELQKKLYEITSKINQAKDYESILKITVEELSKTLNLPGASMHVIMAAISTHSASDKEQSL
jgi:transcriptional regulator with GAF, ATPase, and Fis domain